MKPMMTLAVMMAGLTTFGCAANAQSSNKSASYDTHQTKPANMDKADQQHKNDRAIAVIHPTKGHKVHGIVRFTPTEDGRVRIMAELHDLPPNSMHGFHIHQYGDCSTPDASSAGGHYNPDHHPHAGPKAPPHHAGDLGNIKADGDGNTHLDMTAHDITVDGSKNPILGRAVIVHEKADDLHSQPTGDAGGRIGCGVIGLAKK